MNSKTISLTVLMTVAALFVSACGSAAEASQDPTATMPSTVDCLCKSSPKGGLNRSTMPRSPSLPAAWSVKCWSKKVQQVKKGQPLIQLGDESDTNYAAAQLELVSAQQALNDLQNTSGTDLAQAVIDLKEAKEDYDKADDYLQYLQEFQESRPNRNPQLPGPDLERV